MNKKITTEEFRAAIERQLSGLKPDPRLAQRILASEKEEKPVAKKLSMTAVLVIVLICVSVTGAIAAVLNNWGIKDFLGLTSGYIPKNAEETISKEEISAEAAHFSCTIQESFYDGKILRMTARIKPKEPTLLLEAGDLPSDLMEENEQITLGEYAMQHDDGRMAEVNFHLSTPEVNTCALKRNEDGTANLYLEAYYPDELPERDVVAIVTYLPFNDAADKTAEELESGEYALYDIAALERIQIPVHLQSVKTRQFACHAPMDFPEVGVQVTDVVLTVTPLEIRYTLDYAVTDVEKYNALEHGLWFEFIDPDSQESEYYAQRVSDGLTFTASAGRLDGRFDEPETVGTVIRQHDTIGLDALSDEYTIRAYNAWEKTRYESATFQVTEVE